MQYRSGESPEDFLRRRQQAYRAFFDSPIGQGLLIDLMIFCRANASTFHPDNSVKDNLNGRREVWLRIQDHLRLDVETLAKLYGSTKQ